MPEKDREKAPIRFKADLMNEFRNEDKTFDFLNQRKIQKIYNL